MNNIKEKINTLVNTRSVANFLVLAGVAIIVPCFIHAQWITGPMINTVLILILFLVGLRSSLVICLVPSLIALSSGLLPVVLAPVVPFIMISNVIFILTIDWFYTNINKDIKSYWMGLIVGSIFKFLFLFLSVKIISGLLIKQQLIMKVTEMMSWPQLFTAITGGFIAWIVLVKMKKLGCE